MSRLGTITRRAFMIGAAAAAGGIAVGYWYVRRPYPNPLEGEIAEGETTFNPYVKIAPDDTITIIAPRAEMGQGISTTLAAFVAEELDVTLERIKVEHGPASFAYYNDAIMGEAAPFLPMDESFVAETARSALGSVAKVLGLQITGGSSSTRDGFDRMRQAGAATRTMLIEAAAKELNVPASELKTYDGAVIHEGSSRALTYGVLAAEAAKLSPPSTIVLKERVNWNLLGKAQPRVDMRDKVTGAPIFGIDVSLPDMLFGSVKMSPVFWNEPKGADLTKAQAVPGVLKIVPIASTYGHGFGVIATNTWAAMRAAELIEADWGDPTYPADDAAIDAALRDALSRNEGSNMRNDGDVETAFADVAPENFLEADYSAPLLAHACMEPMNATAWLKDAKLEVWSPNQAPTLTQALCASAIGIEADAVKVHTTSMGGGFGRREVDFAVYAAILAKETGNRPIKVTWSREEDIRQDRYRPPARARLRARLGQDGMPEALAVDIAAPSILASILRRTYPSLSPAGPDSSITQGAHDQPYAFPSYKVTGTKTDIGIPVGFWRSVGFSFNTFFLESFLDEIAVAKTIDPLDLRRRFLADQPAALGVIDRVAEMAKWGEALPANCARGFAIAFNFGSWCAQIVEIAQSPSGIVIDKVFIAADVGIALDPRILEQQIVSGSIFGLSAAINQEITVSSGKIEQSNFHDFDAMRMHQCPSFEVAILENHHKMGGAGEVSTPTAIPALVNAVHALTGKRIRQLPLAREVSFA